MVLGETLGLALAAALLLAAKEPSTARAADVIRLASSPSFWYTAAFAPGGDRLVVTDMPSGELQVYSLDGRLQRRIDRPGLGPTEFNRPFRLGRAGASLLLLDGNEHLLELDAKLASRQGWVLPHTEDPGHALPYHTERGKVAEVFLWEAAALDDAFVARGDVRDPKGWRSGVIRFTRAAPFVASLLAETPTSGDTRYLYSLNLKPTIATLGKGVYEVRFGARPQVRQLLPEQRSWAAPGPLDAPLPVLPRLGGFAEQPKLYASLRASPMPAGLYAWQDRLYLLSWQPAAGELRWSLWRLDPASGWRGPMALDLPAGASSAVVAPGPRSWAFLLSGPMTAPETQAFLGVKLVPAARILQELG